MQRIQTITPCLWFDHQAQEAAQFYCSVFERSHITQVSYYGKAGFEIHGRPEGSVMSLAFELDGQGFTALNGGPLFSFSEAISLQVHCRTQGEIDHYWGALGFGGPQQAQQCGWLKDRFGLSWQIVPESLAQMLCDPDPNRRQRVMQALLGMKKLNIQQLQRAFDGQN